MPWELGRLTVGELDEIRRRAAADERTRRQVAEQSRRVRADHDAAQERAYRMLVGDEPVR